MKLSRSIFLRPVNASLAEQFERAIQTLPSIYSEQAFLSDFLRRRGAIVHLESLMSKALEKDDLEKFDLLISVLQAFGSDRPDHKNVYLLMMKFVCCYSEQANTAESFQSMIIAQILDVFWHQSTGLETLEEKGQVLLYECLKTACNMHLEKSEEDGDFFFAIIKSMDLISFQEKHGGLSELVHLFLNHPNDHIRRRAKEMLTQKTPRR